MVPSIVFTTHSALHEYKGDPNQLDYIDHELSVQLDSTDAFEGPEKLLEIWFTPWTNSINNRTLRDIPLVDIEKLLNVVHCEILSKISTPICDAYLLSESSLFVFPYKLILKTCGTTTTLLCLDTLVDIIHDNVDDNFDKRSLAKAERVFYSRRAFNFPELQKSIHKSWDTELKHLNEYFPSHTAHNTILGEGNDTWHFYVNGTANDTANASTYDDANANADVTIEILMTDLEPSRAALFTQNPYEGTRESQDTEIADKGHMLGDVMMRRSGLADIFPEGDSDSDCKFKHDAFSFQPCGYSSNSLTVNGDTYYTIHITPEESCSYASFETNYRPTNEAELQSVVEKVVTAVGARSYTVVVCYESTASLGGVDVVDVDVGHGYRVQHGHHRV